MTEQRLTIRLLGPVEFRTSAGRVTFTTKKAEALLAFLAFSQGVLHPRERLATLLWGETGEDQARQSLRQTIFSIRKAIGFDIFLTEGDRIGINPEMIELDVMEFRHLLDDGSIDALARAVDLPQGELLEGVHVDEESFEGWLLVERERFRETALSAQTKVLDDLVERGKLEPAVMLALNILAIDPVREAVHRTLMQIYMRQGRRDAAIRQYYSCADVLRRRLNIEPDVQTKAFFRDTLAQSTDAAASAHQRPRLLLIEDNTLNREVIRAMLSDFEITTAVDGAQALIALGKADFDLILMDLGLPTVDGFALMEAMKQNQIHTPVIVLTAYQETAHEVRALDLGAADFIRKPIERSVLLKRIARVLGEKVS
jgi:DNA-binding SARP family transcriptional activator